MVAEQFVSKHNLDFEAAPYHTQLMIKEGYFWFAYRVGTVVGLYSYDKDHYIILTITNNQPNNGHFEDVLQWFENSCRRDKKSLVIAEVWNKRLMKHLIEKRGFKNRKGTDCDVIKHF